VKTWFLVSVLGVLLTACGGGQPATQTGGPTASKSPASTAAADENAALDALRKVNDAQSTYFKVNRRYAITLDELIEIHFLKAEPSAAGYDFRLRPAADAQSYRLFAAPKASGSAAAARYLFTDQTGTIRAESGKEATAESPAVS
jgi:hypothetical protein